MTKIAKTDAWKDKIRAGVLVQRLMDCAEGKIEMKATQIKAAEILIRKVIPDLGKIEHVGPGNGPIRTLIEISDIDRKILENYRQSLLPSIQDATYIELEKRH